jgi:hypothetical protein
MVLIEPREPDDVGFGAALPRMTLTDLEGAFRFDNVEPGEVRLAARDRVQLSSLTSWWEPFAMTAQAEGEVTVEAGKVATTTLLVGSAYEGIDTGLVEGDLWVNGKPGAGWKVRTWGEIRRSVTVADDGHFDMGPLAAGQVVLIFSPPGRSFMDGGMAHTHELDLPPEGHEFAEVRIATGAVTGRVFSDVDGRPVEGARVSIVTPEQDGNWWSRMKGAGITGPDGRFEVEPVVKGTYLASVEAEGFARTTSEPFDVHALGTTAGVEVRLRSALVIKGTLTVMDMEMPGWMWLVAESEDGSQAMSRPENKDGVVRFAFDDLAPGTWTFTLHGGTESDLATVTLQLHQSTEDLRLVFRPAPPQEPEVIEEGDEPVQTEAGGGGG